MKISTTVAMVSRVRQTLAYFQLSRRMRAALIYRVTFVALSRSISLTHMRKMRWTRNTQCRLMVKLRFL